MDADATGPELTRIAHATDTCGAALPATTGEAAGARDYPADRPLRWRGAAWAVGAGVSAYALMRALAGSPRLAELTVGTGALPGPWLSRVTGVVPFAVAELLLAGYAGSLAVPLVSAGIAVARRKRRLRNALACGALRLGRDAGVILTLFYVLWGFNYARPPWTEQVGWPAWEGADPDEILALAEAATDAVNAAYLELHGMEDAGQPTPLPGDRRALDAALQEGWRAAAAHLGLPERVGARHGRAKYPRSSLVLAHLGISGVYVPFTGEALVTDGQPALVVPVTLGHEMAHQRGFTGEADASFLGFIASAFAPDPLARYAAAYYAHAQLVAALATADREAATRLVERRLPGVHRDVQDAAAFYRRFQGPARSIGRGVNDRYLRAQGVAEGVRDYQRSVQQIVIYARLHDGVVVPGRPPARLDEF